MQVAYLPYTYAVVHRIWSGPKAVLIGILVDTRIGIVLSFQGNTRVDKDVQQSMPCPCLVRSLVPVAVLVVRVASLSSD